MSKLDNQTVVVGRLAPSPTGVLHLGNARSFLLAWLDLRSRGGHMVLRMEDLDGPRVKAGAARLAMEDLRWLGLDWDEGPIYQRPRLEIYSSYLQRLAEAGLAYPCVCTRKDVEQAASAPHPGEEGPVYSGTCRGLWRSAVEAQKQTGKLPCWRFAIPIGTKVDFSDRICGATSLDLAQQGGDFVIWKKDNEPAYQLAVVVDDAEQKINSVVRGDDLISSAGRQILIYQAFGFPVPEFAHVPLVVGTDGRRLAKRHGDTTVRQFREQGISSAQILRMLAATFTGAISVPLDRIHQASDLLPGFRLEAVGSKPVQWDGKELLA